MIYQLPPEHVLVLRTSNKDRISYGDFQWPESGPVEAPDWNQEPICGRGLHGALWGEGDGALFNWVEDATWQVVEVLFKDIVDLGGKIKFPQGNVVFSGSREGATNFLLANGGFGRAVIGAKMSNLNPNGHVLVGYRGTATVGDWGKATAGAYGTANAGNRGTANAGREGTANAGREGTANAGREGTANAGDLGTATAGDYGKANAGDYGKATAGFGGTANVGDWGTANAGEGGTATAGYNGTANAGFGGTATAGIWGKATAGDYGTVNALDYGTANAGIGGKISIDYWDGTRSRTKGGYIGEDGLEPNTPYKLDETFNFVKA